MLERVLQCFSLILYSCDFFFLDITTAIQPSVTVEILVMLFISFIYMCVIKWSSYQAQVHFTEDTLGRVRYRYDMSECEQVMLFI